MIVKDKKGKELEIEETEVIKAVQEEYENKLKAKDDEIAKLKETSEKEKQALREEHAKQVRTILSGKRDENVSPEFEDDPVDEEETLLKQAKEYYKKM